MSRERVNGGPRRQVQGDQGGVDPLLPGGVDRDAHWRECPAPQPGSASAATDSDHDSAHLLTSAAAGACR